MGKNLEQLYRRVDRCRFCKASGNPLHHIPGIGALRPRLMLILINPTHTNISSAPEYRGLRFPFVGVRQFWRVLADGGLIGKKLAYGLPLKRDWKFTDTEALVKELRRRHLFLTDAVKCCYPHSNYPPKKIFEYHKRFTAEEIRMVKPQRIIAFGSRTFQFLTGENIHLTQYWHQRKKNTYHERYPS